MAKKQATKGLTCAVAIIDCDKNILIVHPTNAKLHAGWSLPKGMQEDGETPAEAAIREVYEETGLMVDNLEDIGRYAYTAKKDLHLFVCRLDNSLKGMKFECTSTFEDNGKQIKEIDRFLVCDFDAAFEFLNHKQSSILAALEDFQ